MKQSCLHVLCTRINRREINRVVVVGACAYLPARVGPCTASGHGKQTQQRQARTADAAIYFARNAREFLVRSWSAQNGEKSSIESASRWTIVGFHFSPLARAGDTVKVVSVTAETVHTLDLTSPCSSAYVHRRNMPFETDVGGTAETHATSRSSTQEKSSSARRASVGSARNAWRIHVSFNPG